MRAVAPTFVTLLVIATDVVKSQDCDKDTAALTANANVTAAFEAFRSTRIIDTVELDGDIADIQYTANAKAMETYRTACTAAGGTAAVTNAVPMVCPAILHRSPTPTTPTSRYIPTVAYLTMPLLLCYDNTTCTDEQVDEKRKSYHGFAISYYFIGKRATEAGLTGDARLDIRATEDCSVRQEDGEQMTTTSRARNAVVWAAMVIGPTLVVLLSSAV